MDKILLAELNSLFSNIMVATAEIRSKKCDGLTIAQIERIMRSIKTITRAAIDMQRYVNDTQDYLTEQEYEVVNK